MADETPVVEINPVKGFWRSLMSSSPDASYGRFISANAFVVLIALHILFSINPHNIFSAVENQAQVLQYLFILVISGYSVTAAKDVIPQISGIFGRMFSKKSDAPVPPAPAKDE
jgi:hypothetical protein